MATVNLAGELLTVGKRDENYVPFRKKDLKRPIPGGSQHEHKDDEIGESSDSDDSDYNDRFNYNESYCKNDDDGGKNDDGDFQSSPASPNVKVTIDNRLSFHEPTSPLSLSDKQDEDWSDIRETTSNNSRNPNSPRSLSVKKDEDGNGITEIIDINSHDDTIPRSLSDKKDDAGNDIRETIDTNSHDPNSSSSLSDKKDDDGSDIRETTPDNSHDPKSPRSLSDKKDDDGSVMSDTTPIVFHDPNNSCSLSDKKDDDGSVMSDTTPIVFHNPNSPHSLSDKKDDDGSDVSETIPVNFHKSNSDRSFGNIDSKDMSDTTPINFLEPSSVYSLSSKKDDDGSDLSDTTPIKFHESSGHLTLGASSDGVDASFKSNRRLDSSDHYEFRSSQRALGIGSKKSSQRFNSEMYDNEIDEYAGSNITMVYLETTAFAKCERINLTEDIYSFVLACSCFSLQFWVAIYFIFVKYLCYGVLLSQMLLTPYEGESKWGTVLATKFLMIPVSVAMQEDLITVYYNLANKKYDALTLKRNRYATEPKWILCNLLRAIDGLMSMSVNFGVMLFNDETLNIFLSFAALHFLQFIDDVIYELAEKGFFGHKMEQATIDCKVVTFTRRITTQDNWNNFILNLDTILLFLSVIILYLVYLGVVIFFYSNQENRDNFMNESNVP